MLRMRVAMKGLLLTLGIWLVFAIGAEALNASWPHAQPDIRSCFDLKALSNTKVLDGSTIASAFHIEDCKQQSRFSQWENFLTLTFIIEFLWLKSWMMTRMSRRFDRLGVSLIAANMAFSIAYLIGVIAFLFPHWTWIDSGRELIRYGLILTLAYGLYQLLIVPDFEGDWDGSDRRNGLERRQGWIQKGS